MRRMKSWELGVLVGLVVVVALLMLPAFNLARHGSARTGCANHLKQLGLVVKMYSNEYNGYYPPVSPIPGNWMMDLGPVYPDFVTDLDVFRCPGSPFFRKDAFTRGGPRDLDPACVSGLFYNYTGRALSNDEQGAAFWAARDVLPPEVFGQRDLALPQPTWERSDGRHVGGLPIVWDRVTPEEGDMPHRPLGINVLHMDGSVQFVPYSPWNNSSNFPATRIAAITYGADLPAMPPGCR